MPKTLATRIAWFRANIAWIILSIVVCALGIMIGIGIAYTSCDSSIQETDPQIVTLILAKNATQLKDAIVYDYKQEMSKIDTNLKNFSESDRGDVKKELNDPEYYMEACVNNVELLTQLINEMKDIYNPSSDVSTSSTPPTAPKAPTEEEKKKIQEDIKICKSIDAAININKKTFVASTKLWSVLIMKNYINKVLIPKGLSDATKIQSTNCLNSITTFITDFEDMTQSGIKNTNYLSTQQELNSTEPKKSITNTMESLNKKTITKCNELNKIFDLIKGYYVLVDV